MRDIFEAAEGVVRLAPEMLEPGEEFSYTYNPVPEPTLVIVATGETARKLYPLANVLMTVVQRD